MWERRYQWEKCFFIIQKLKKKTGEKIRDLRAQMFRIQLDCIIILDDLVLKLHVSNFHDLCRTVKLLTPNYIVIIISFIIHFIHSIYLSVDLSNGRANIIWFIEWENTSTLRERWWIGRSRIVISSKMLFTFQEMKHENKYTEHKNVANK